MTIMYRRRLTAPFTHDTRVIQGRSQGDIREIGKYYERDGTTIIEK